MRKQLGQSVEQVVCTAWMAMEIGVLVRGNEWCSVGWLELAGVA